ncbi:hypothetical protein ACFYXH_22140 [Streptomyces sp. NPDC002730]|uniref:hypothetical protein n=1 Tax=Streptomyces sp. NPDC002730 TaxID=3364662 RepID=UPI003693AC47
MGARPPTHFEVVAFGTEEVPLIPALKAARAEKDAADGRIRRLLACARKFHAPRRYSLNELGGAEASGYTISGVRTAYNDAVVDMVGSQIDRKPRDVALSAADGEQS